MMEVNCPKCATILTLPNKKIYNGGCPRCGTKFTIRKGKTYEQSDIVSNFLYCLTVLFASITRCDIENKNIYCDFFNNFLKTQTFTKNQFNDINKVFQKEQKSIFHENYKDIVKNLKDELDLSYKKSPLEEQQKVEDSIFSLLFKMAISTGTINEKQQKILDCFLKIFEISDERKNLIINEFTPKKQENKNVNIEDAFFKISSDIQNMFLSQDVFINELMAAFKRPFISKPSKNYKNLIAILTSEDDLVCDVLGKITKGLKEEAVIFGGLSFLDCANFNQEDSNSAFLSSLENLFNSSSEIIILKNLKALSASGLNVLNNLIQTGLINNTTFENKYIILMTSGNTDEFEKLVGENIINSINDIVKLEELTDEEIISLIQNYLNNFIYKTREELALNLFYDPILIDYLKTIYSSNIGLKSILVYIEHNIHKPLIEYKLKKQPLSSTQIVLSIQNNKPIIQSEDNIIFLEKLVPQKHNVNLDEIKEELNKIIGLSEVKDYVLKLEDTVAAQKMRKDAGLKTNSISMNMIFTGNPGTGKTTIARIVAKYLKALGVLSKGHLVEVTRNDLVGEYQGQTAQKAANIINSALGGVLFIDEAYSLCRGANDSFGLEAVDILVKMMEDNKNNLVVILAGYSKEMKEFLKNNSGLKSRFPNIINFSDYTPNQMYKIADNIAKSNDYTIDPKCIEPLINYFEIKNINGINNMGNGRLARNTIEKAILNQSNRIIHENDGDFKTLKLIDFEIKEKEEFNLEEELSKIIGLNEVKDYIRALWAKIKINKERKNLGLITNNVQTLHMIFMGNPGTGKTMMARTVANLLYNLNIIGTNNLVETDRAGLVAGYVGQTAEKTTEKVYEALNGVLFIDEAYSLSSGGENDFGKEAIDTLVKLMDDNRDRLVVILAGYEEDMNKFLETNPGLLSRFPNRVLFSDYSITELMEIMQNMFSKNGYELSNNASIKAKSILEEAKENPQFGNGRYVRNMFEKAITNQALRVSSLSELTKQDLIMINEEDIEKI